MFLYACSGSIIYLEQECSEGNVRLVDGSTAGDGQVQICIGGLWGSVCNDRWDTRDAQVVCRQLLFDGRKTFQFNNDRDNGYPLYPSILPITTSRLFR